jgi:hypothetical protein
MDVSVFMHVLQKTVEFEKELQQRFAVGGADVSFEFKLSFKLPSLANSNYSALSTSL